MVARSAAHAAASRPRMARATRAPRRRSSSRRCTGPARRCRPTSSTRTSSTSPIGGERFEHLICHPVLPYSNWEWGDDLQLGVADGAARGRADRALPARPRARVAPDGQFYGRDAPPDRREEASFQRRVPGSDGPLRDEAAHHRGRREQPERRRRGAQRRIQAPARPSTCSSVAAATSRASSPTRRGCSRSRPRRTRCE